VHPAHATARTLPAATALLAAALTMMGCANTVVPPENPARPVAAFLLDHGRHASLVLETEEGMTRYAWGDWDYYALNRTGPLRASGALFAANTSGLARKRLPGPAAATRVRRQVAVPIEALWRIEVAEEHAHRLHARVDQRFREARATLTINPLYDLEFVHGGEPYNWTRNSNHQVGYWLRALGCEVRMGGPFSDWRVTEPGARSSPADHRVENRGHEPRPPRPPPPHQPLRRNHSNRTPPITTMLSSATG
jgi:hypothetical protein